MLYSVINFKHGFILFLAFKLFLVQNITLVSVPGVPLLTLDMFMSIVYSFWFFTRKNKRRLAKYSFPYMTPQIVLCVSWFVSSIFSVAGMGAELSSLIGDLVNNFILLVVLWEILETKDDFDFLFGLVTLIIFGSCIYAMLEYQMGVNPLKLYTATLNRDPSRTIDWSYSSLSARGYHVQSIFEHAIGAGMIWALYSVFVFTSIVKYNEKLRFITLAIITAVLCLPAMILTKQRSCLVFYFIAALGFIKPQKKRTYLILIPLMAGLALFSTYLMDNIDILLSIFSKKAQASVAGSTAEMRFGQLDAAFRLFVSSPIWGLGSKFASVIHNTYVSRLLGGESIWFSVIPGYGMLGIVAYIFSAYWMIYKIPRYFKSVELFYVSLAYWIVITLTSVPGFKLYLVYLYFVYFIKKSDVYKCESDLRQDEWKMKKLCIIHRHVF